MSFRIADGHVEVHLQDHTQPEWQRIRRRLEQAARDPIRVQVRVDIDGDEEALRRIRMLNDHLLRLRLLAARPVEIRVDADTAGAEAALIRLRLHMALLRSQSLQFGSAWQFNWQQFTYQSNQWTQNFQHNMNQVGRAGAMNMRLVAAGLAALPALATAASGAVTFTLGGALSGLGLIFAAQSDVVRDEASLLARDLGMRMRDISQPFQRTWVDIFDTARTTFDQLAPALQDAFQELAPTMSGFVRDLGKAFEQFGPHISEWVRDFQALLGHLGPQLETVFSNIGQALTELTNATGRNPELFGEMLQDASALLVVLGQLTGAATDFYGAMNPWSGKLTEATGSTSALIDVLLEFAKIGQAINNPISGLAYIWDKFTGPIGDAITIMRGGSPATYELASGLNNLSQAAATAAQSQPAANNAFAQLDAELRKAADTTLNLDQRLQALKNAMDELLNPSLALFNTKTQLAAGMDQLRKAIDKSNGSLSRWTATGRAAREALSRQVNLTSQLGHNTQAATGSFDKAKAAVAAQIPFLWKMAAGSKEAQNQVLALARSWKISGQDAFGAKKQADSFNAALRRLPSRRTTKIETPGIGDAIRASKSLNSAVRSVPTSWTTYFRTVRIGDAIRNSKDLNYADGGFYGGVSFNARGNLYSGGGESHTAQIARGGMVRIWAEPETGGEAYIPLASSKRERSEQILAQVAEQFGLMLTRPVSFADGGMTAVAGAPKLGVREDRTTLVPEAAQKAMAKLLRELTRSMMSSLDKVNEWAKKVNEQIRKNFSGAAEQRLLGWAKGIEKQMRAAATRAEQIAAKLKEAREFAASTTDAARQFASVQGLGTVGGAKDVLSGKEFRAGQLETFASQIAALQKRGLNAGLLEEVIGLGAGQGSNLAEAYLKADPETFRKLNEAQAAIDKAAKAIGNNAADALFDSGKNAGKGFLAGLLGRQAELYALFDRLADRLTNRLGDAFDVPKPKPKLGTEKTVTRRASGGIVRAGQWARVGERGAELVRFGSDAMVYSNRQSEQLLAGGGVHIGAINVNVNGTFDLADASQRRRIAEALAADIREAVRREENKYR